MNVSESKNIITTQISLERTPKGRPITEYGVECLQACLDDEGNQDAEVVTCKNCGMAISVLLTSDGCPNCGGLDF